MNETVKQILENHLARVSRDIEWETENLVALRGEAIRLEKKLTTLKYQKTDLLRALEGL